MVALASEKVHFASPKFFRLHTSHKTWDNSQVAEMKLMALLE